MEIVIFSDNKVRDLHGIIYLASALKENNINTYIIPWNVPEDVLRKFVGIIKPSAVLLSQARQTTEKIYSIFTEVGSKIYIHESEGWPYKRALKDYTTILSEEIINNSNGNFLWGKEQKKITEAKLGKKETNIVSGSVRLEALTKIQKREVKRNALLVALSCAVVFPRYNSMDAELLLHVNSLKMPLNDYLESVASQLKNQERLLAAACAIKRRVSDLTIYVRPHPFGCVRQLEEALVEYGLTSDVYIEDNIMVHESLSKCGLVIHGGSTISLEAYYYGLLSMTSAAITNTSVKNQDHIGFTYNADNMEELIDKAVDYLNTKDIPELGKREQDWLYEKKKVNEKSASEKIVEKITSDLKGYSDRNRVNSDKGKTRTLKSKLGLFLTDEVDGDDEMKKYRDGKYFTQSDIDNCMESFIHRKKQRHENPVVLFISKKHKIPIAAFWQSS